MILRSPRKLLLVLTTSVLVTIWGITITMIVNDGERIYRSANAELTGAIPVLRLHARRSLDTAHAILVAIDEALQTGGDDVDFSRLRGLAARLQSSNEDPIDIGIIGADEQLIRIEGSSGGIFVGDREYMTAIRMAEPGRLYIGETLIGRSTGRVVIPMVMKARENDADVEFILAAMPVAGFDEAYRDLLVSAPSAIGLLRSDGMVLHLTPDPKERVGKILPGFDLITLQLQYAPMTAFDQDRRPDLGLRIKASYAPVEPYPLVVAAALRAQALDDEWYAQAWPKAIGTTIGSIVVLALTAWLFILMARRDAALRRITEAMVELDGANRAKRDFMARMSHELRTPLNAIIGFSEVISGALVGPLGKAYQDYGRDIHRSGEHLLGMINQVLDITRIEADALVMKEVPMDIGTVAAEARDILRNLAQSCEVTIRFEVDPAARRMLADPIMVRQMMLNLLSNALKASPAGTTVEIRSEAVEDGGIRLQVIDQGVGIRPEKRAQIFEPFGSGQSMLADRSAGIGLGLPITRKLIEMHGGTLTLVSGQQGGTTATLTFPPARRIAA